MWCSKWELRFCLRPLWRSDYFIMLASEFSAGFFVLCVHITQKTISRLLLFWISSCVFYLCSLSLMCNGNARRQIYIYLNICLLHIFSISQLWHCHFCCFRFKISMFYCSVSTISDYCWYGIIGKHLLPITQTLFLCI